MKRRMMSNGMIRALDLTSGVARLFSIILNSLKKRYRRALNIAVNAARAKEQTAENRFWRRVMSVIGRLDKQVDEVLISPLEKRETKINPDQPENSDSEKSVDSARREVNKREERDALPVWLL